MILHNPMPMPHLEKWLVAIALLLPSFPSDAQQYKWVDENGKVHYTGTPPPLSAKSVEKKSFKGSVVDSVTPFALTRAAKNSPVTMYTSPPCGDACNKARDALNKRGIPFKEVQVWDEDTSAEIRRISGSSEVPVLLVGRSMQKGFEQSAFDRLLDIAGYPPLGIVPAGKLAAPPVPEDYKPNAASGAAQPPAPAAVDKK